jgi:hypothetical protein
MHLAMGINIRGRTCLPKEPLVRKRGMACSAMNFSLQMRRFSSSAPRAGSLAQFYTVSRQQNKIAMKTENKKGSGQSFTEQQKSTDKAINERIKEEKDKSTLDPADANNPNNRDTQSDTASKKTGGGKQKNPGM